MAKSVQIYGSDSLITAAKNRGCSYWAIFQDKQFMFKREDNNIDSSMAFLEQVLECLDRSKAIYTIRFYEPDDDGKKFKIKDTTPYDGSLNFVTSEPEEHESNMQRWEGSRAVGSTSGRMIDAINKLNEKIDTLSTPIEEEEEKPETIGSIALGLLKNPEQLAQLIAVGKSILGIPSVPVLPMPARAGIGSTGADGSSSAAGTVPKEEIKKPEPKEVEYERIAAAVDILAANDPKLADHLEKLAKISQTNKPLFNIALSTIEALQ